jgi:lysine-ketoglutarate reductase/saccharopine dehydrogenase-like protein (TIGR00300 family)
VNSFPTDAPDASLTPVDVEGVLPEDFFSTTNFPTWIRVEGEWVPVQNLEMDCGVRVWKEGGEWKAATCPMHRCRVGDLLVTGFEGTHIVTDSESSSEVHEFQFMSNEVSTERPKRRMIEVAANAMRAARAEGKRNLLVGGPAIVHCGCADVLADLIRLGWIDLLFAGNALAAHDIESSMMGTSLGVDLSSGKSSAHGHTHHLRAINRVRRAGSIKAAVEQGLIPSGIMAACVETNTPFVLCGSIRDDGPLPDVITDAVQAVDKMRTYISEVGVALMVATTLHSVAVGNILPVSVATFAVDSDADTVIKLTDRGTHQAVGIVTDCEFFMRELHRQLTA